MHSNKPNKFKKRYGRKSARSGRSTKSAKSVRSSDTKPMTKTKYESDDSDSNFEAELSDADSVDPDAELVDPDAELVDSDDDYDITKLRTSRKHIVDSDSEDDPESKRLYSDMVNGSGKRKAKYISDRTDQIDQPGLTKRPRTNNFGMKCSMYCLPDDWKEDMYDKLKLTSEQKTVLNDRYNDFKHNLIQKQIDLKMILELDNILESERNMLLEKFSLLIASENDLSTYVKIRDEMNNMIKYYKSTDVNLRKETIDKKKELDSVIINTSEIEHKILNMYKTKTNISASDIYVQSLIYQKYKKLTNLSPSDTEYYKLKEWLDYAIKIPTTIKNNPITNIGDFLSDIKKSLDKELYGMDSVKEELLMAINQRLTNPAKADTSIALVGPPGVGKTKIISALAKIMNYPWEHISMGGINDPSFLAGHSYTYEGAKPGRLAQCLFRMECTNGILFFDEIDKIAETSNGKEVSNQLLHITDFSQNDHFCDHYLAEIPIDLSKMWFIFSLNSIPNIDPILRNRLNFIYVDGYTNEEKITIVKEYLLPLAYDKYNLSQEKYPFSDSIIKMIVSHSVSKEKSNDSPLIKGLEIPNLELNNQIHKTGIRELKRSLDKIFNRLSLLDNMSLNNKSVKSVKLVKSVKGSDQANPNNTGRERSNSDLVDGLSFKPDNLNKIKITEELIEKFLS